VIAWSDSVPHEARKRTYTLKRCPTAGRLFGIVTVDNLVGCYTHWYGGKTVPCQSPECKPCKEGVPKRWHSYVAAWNPKSNEEFLFECTGQGAEYFEHFRSISGTLKGCLFVSERLGSRHNGRVVITCKPADLSSIRLPDPLDVISVLSVIWQIPLTSIKGPDHGLLRQGLSIDSEISGVMNDPILEHERKRKRA
jgi:hypothetical protein